VPKFGWARPASNHPFWIWQGIGGILFAVIVFGAAIYVRDENARTLQWLGVGANALVGGALFGWTIENIPIESLGVAGWARSLMLATVAFLAPVVLSMAIVQKGLVPSFAQLLGPKEQRASEPLGRSAGAILLAVMLLAFLVALGLVFDPRYRDFPFAPLTAAILPFVVHGFLVGRAKGTRGIAEMSAACVLALSVVYIAFNETFANWQSLWVCAVLAALAFNLAQVRDAQS
jgi:glucan 1,3-beta-glucosidase